MKFGVLQFFSWPGRRTPLSTVYQRALERIEIMDQNGYDAVWLTEHHFTDYSVCPSIPVLGSYAAARTKNLRIGTGVCLAESKDGLTFDSVEQVFPNDSTPFKINAGDPTVLPMDEGPWLMYFGNGQDHNEQGIWIAQRSD